MSLTGYNPYTYARGFRNQEFHHVVLSVSGTVHTLYLDGVQVQQNAAAGNIFATYQTITNTVIGAQTTLGQAFQGTIGDVRVYNYAIPPTLVTSLYRDRELIVYYPFDTSVNSLTPNYATLVYDASLIGQSSITASAGANVGSGALSLTNTAGSVATQYVLTTPGIAGQVGWIPDISHGITIAGWINVAGISNRIQRIFDIPLTVGTKGLSVDISGTNMLYSGWKFSLAPTDYIFYYPLVSDFTEKVKNITLTGTNASFSNITPSPSVSGSAFFNLGYVSSTNAALHLPNIIDYSFSIWIYPTGTVTTAIYYVFDFYSGGTNAIAVYILNNRIKITVQNNPGDADYDISSITNNVWTHFVWTVTNRKTYNFYINGNNISSTTMTNGIPSANRGNVGIGISNFSVATEANSNTYFRGYLSDFQVYNRPLSQSEITNIYTKV